MSLESFIVFATMHDSSGPSSGIIPSATFCVLYKIYTFLIGIFIQYTKIFKTIKIKYYLKRYNEYSTASSDSSKLADDSSLSELIIVPELLCD